MDKISLRRGRPPRGQFDHLRTKIWVGSIVHEEGLQGINLARSFADNSVWQKTWDRYKKGIVNPSRHRVEEIAALLPGTDRYFFTPLWDILENREYSNQELQRFAFRLPPLIRRAFASTDDAFSGKFWATRTNPQLLMRATYSSLGDDNFAIDCFSALVLSLRLAEQAQDSNSYLFAMKCISAGRHKLDAHPVLSALPLWLFRDLVEPLRRIRFARAEDDHNWDTARRRCIARSGERMDSFNVLQALDSYTHKSNEYNYENEEEKN